MKLPDSMFNGENLAAGIMRNAAERAKIQRKVFKLIKEERVSQDDKWGADRKHHPLYWLAILTEEVGEFAKAVIDRDIPGMKVESKQVAAVATAIMENMDYCVQELSREIKEGKGTGDESRP